MAIQNKCKINKSKQKKWIRSSTMIWLLNIIEKKDSNARNQVYTNI